MSKLHGRLLSSSVPTEPSNQRTIMPFSEWLRRDKISFYFMSMCNDLNCRIALSNAGNGIHTLSTKVVSSTFQRSLDILAFQSPDINLALCLDNQ